MLVTEKGGKLFLATPAGQKPKSPACRRCRRQNGLLGVYLAPSYASDGGDLPDLFGARRGSGHLEPGARARDAQIGNGTASLEDLKVIWRDPIKGKGGQVGAAVAFSPDQKFLFLTAGDRQRFTPAQDPNQPAGKILRLTLDGKPAPGNPMAGKTGASVGRRDRSAERHGGRQDRAGRAHLCLRRPEPDAVRDMDARAIARPTASRSRRTDASGSSSTGRAAATSSTSSSRARTTAGRWSRMR